MMNNKIIFLLKRTIERVVQFFYEDILVDINGFRRIYRTKGFLIIIPTKDKFLLITFFFKPEINS